MRPACRLLAAVFAALLLVASCGDDGGEADPPVVTDGDDAEPAVDPDDEPSDGSRSVPVGQAPSDPDPGDDDPGEVPVDDDQEFDPLVLCDTYLDFLSPIGAFDDAVETMRLLIEFEDVDLANRLSALTDPDADFEDIASVISDLEDFVLDRCADVYRFEVQGAGDNQTAGQALFDAIVAGDIDAASAVATANVRAQFEGQGPIAPDPDTGAPNFRVDGDTMSMLLEPTITVFCEFEPGDVGIVTRCAFGE